MDGGMAGGAMGTSSSDFVRKLYKMLESPIDENVVRWGNEGDSFVVLENEKFTKHILPKHFKHSNFASFVRQLNKYDFHKVRHNNEENGQSPYGPGAWEFKHPDFKANNKDALENIKRKAPAPRKPNSGLDDALIPTQQVDMLNSQLIATQQQLQTMQERYAELTIHHSMLVQEVIGLQKTVVNHEHVMQNVMNFLHSVDAQRRRDSRAAPTFVPNAMSNGESLATQQSLDDDSPASPLQHASKLLSETNADVMLNPRHLQEISEHSMRLTGTLNTTPPPELLARGIGRPSSRNAPLSATSNGSLRESALENLVYPVGVDQGINPMYSEHINNIPYPMPVKPPEAPVTEKRKKSAALDPGWNRQPHVLLVEDDPTCRRIGGKFLHAFNCTVDSALDGLEAVNKMNAGAKYDLILMDIIMPNLDGVSACHLVRQFDNTPVIAMTSNIRSDDIQMYFQHGMNDVLPKPFTKEGLMAMLEKHLAHMKKNGHGLDSGIGPSPNMIHPPLGHLSARGSLKEEDSPAKSPATTANWASPGHVPGVSPIASGPGMGGGGPGGGSAGAEEYMHHVNSNAASGMYGMGGAGMQQPGMPYGAASSAVGQPPPQHQQQQHQQSVSAQHHRRQISDISGGDESQHAAKRQQMYAQMPAQTINPLHRPR